MEQHIEVSYNRLGQSTLDIAMHIADVAYPGTVQGCWETLDKWLYSDRITKATYNEIKNNVTFELVSDED